MTPADTESRSGAQVAAAIQALRQSADRLRAMSWRTVRGSDWRLAVRSQAAALEAQARAIEAGRREGSA